jgi:uncharacterized membrane protein YczE
MTDDPRTPPAGVAGHRRHSAEVLQRLPQLLIGLVIFGSGLALIIRGGYGQGPWTVFHEGVSLHTPLSIGGATIATGTVVLVIVIILREPIGIGTIANVVVIGLSTDITLALFDQPESTSVRVLLTFASPLLVALGSGLYLGVHLGPGPRDGLMTGLQKRGLAIWKARFFIEVVAFVLGLILGGTIGLGTVWWLLVMGPAVQLMMGLFNRSRIDSVWSDLTRRELPPG